MINTSFAQEAVDLQKGQSAPFSGVLLSQIKADSVKKELLEKDKLQEINESFKRSILLHKENETYYEQQTKFLRDENKELSKKVTLSTIEKIAWVTLGIIATGVAFKGVQTIAK